MEHERARKDAICRPGYYIGLPYEVAARTDLTPADKLVYGALLDFLRGQALEVYPAAATVAMMAGLSVRAVHRSMRTLVAKGDIIPRGRPGHSTAYGFAVQPRASLHATLAKLADPTPDKLAEDPCQIGVPPLTGCHAPLANLADVNTHGKRNTSTEDSALVSPPATTETKPGALDATWLRNQIDDAHRQVYGVGMPAKWTAKIQTEIERGDPALLAMLDADAIRAGQRLARDARGTFGFGWVVRYLTDRVAARMAAEANGRQATEAELQRRAAEQLEREQRDNDCARQRAWFATRPTDVQERYRRQVAQRSPVAMTANLTDRMAAAAAWTDAQVTETPSDVQPEGAAPCERALNT